MQLRLAHSSRLDGVLNLLMDWLIGCFTLKTWKVYLLNDYEILACNMPDRRSYIHLDSLLDYQHQQRLNLLYSAMEGNFWVELSSWYLPFYANVTLDISSWLLKLHRRWALIDCIEQQWCRIQSQSNTRENQPKLVFLATISAISSDKAPVDHFPCRTIQWSTKETSSQLLPIILITLQSHHSQFLSASYKHSQSFWCSSEWSECLTLCV